MYVLRIRLTDQIFNSNTLVCFKEIITIQSQTVHSYNCTIIYAHNLITMILKLQYFGIHNVIFLNLEKLIKLSFNAAFLFQSSECSIIIIQYTVMKRCRVMLSAV